MAAIDSAYQYYLSTYGNSNVSRYDTHKKSQLRDVYNRIVKSNKDSPLYKFKDTGDVKKHAIDIKESTRNIQNVIDSLSESGGGIEGVFSKKIAQSSDESVVTAEYVGKDDDSEITGFEIQVNQLASAQTNLGNYLTNDRLDVDFGTYSFDLNTNTSSYEFQFSVTPSDTNVSLLQKLAKLVNNAGIGLNATLESNDIGQSALKITSRQTGIAPNEEFLFQILPSTAQDSMDAMNTLGINHVETEARNSSFLLNNMEYASYSNTFTIDNNFDITLHGVTNNGQSAQVGFKTNADAIADNVTRLVDAYNNIIRIGHTYDDSHSPNRLVRDFSSCAKEYRNELEAMGLNIDADNFIQIDRSLLTDAVTAEDAPDSFAILNEFKDSLSHKTKEASVNPMNYVNKVIVAYKNPGRNFATPYITSIYSGMMLDTFC